MNFIFENELKQREIFKAFLRDEALLKRSKRRQNLTFAVVFLAALIGSALIGEVSILEFIQGMPSFFDYFGQTMPEIRPASAAADITNWYWGIDRWYGSMWWAWGHLPASWL